MSRFLQLKEVSSQVSDLNQVCALVPFFQYFKDILVCMGIPARALKMECGIY